MDFNIGPNVPAFLVKLWRLVEDPQCELINWSESGMSFTIKAQARFAREVLPMHYKHNNMASFIRQLNMYDFHKISSLESGALRSDRDELEFGHQYFIRDHPYLLDNIKRKMSHPRPPPAPPAENPVNDNARNGPQPDIFSRLLSDVNVLKGKQDTWDARLSAMKRENEALWRELAVFRQKHLKQEQIINRLIHFIVTIVQPNRKVPIPRRFPLMLYDLSQIKKIPKVNTTNGSSSRASPPGPTIHEIEGDVLINGNEIRHPSGTGNGNFIYASFSDSASNVQVQDFEPQVLKGPVLINPDTASKKGNASDWLEIVLTEDDMVTPLTPVNPAEVNPVVAAATLKHLEIKKKLAVPVTMDLQPLATQNTCTLGMGEKKIIYLADVPKNKKTLKEKQVEPEPPKNQPYKNKRVILPKNISIIESVDNNLESANYENATVSKVFTIPAPPKAFAKRKLSLLNSPTESESPYKRQNFEVNPVAEAASEQYSPLPTPNTLENLLNLNLIEANNIKDNVATKEQTQEDPFWKFESLYNGPLTVNELITVETDEENPIEDQEIIEEVVEDLPIDNIEKTSEINISDVCANDVQLPKLSQKNDAESSDVMVDFPPESMAVVCQSSASNEELFRELSAHVESVQGEIDYLKEVIKGEGYNLDMNNLLEYFNEDPLSYGLLQTAEEEPKEKENDKVVTGNEVITYGSANNLMELVDLFGSSSTVQDWSNATAPVSPAVSELIIPADSEFVSPAVSELVTPAASELVTPTVSELVTSASSPSLANISKSGQRLKM